MQNLLYSHDSLESIIYKLQSTNKILDPCVVDDLITLLYHHKKTTNS